MDNLEKKQLWEKHFIHVGHLRFSNDSKCNQEGCNNPDEYGVFVGGYQLSNLIGTCCGEHLSKFVDDAIEYRNKTVESIIKKREENELKIAKELINKQKIESFKEQIFKQ